MVIGLPDVGSWAAKLSGSRWNNYLLEHLWYFDKKTLRIFMERAGFNLTHHRTEPYDAPLAHIVRRVAHDLWVLHPHDLGRHYPGLYFLCRSA